VVPVRLRERAARVGQDRSATVAVGVVLGSLAGLVGMVGQG